MDGWGGGDAGTPDGGGGFLDARFGRFRGHYLTCARHESIKARGRVSSLVVLTVRLGLPSHERYAFVGVCGSCRTYTTRYVCLIYEGRIYILVT